MTETVSPVFLTEAEMERARRIANTRNSKNGMVPNARHDKDQGDFEMHFLGARAEMGVCKMFNYPIDDAFSWGGDDKAPDLYVGELRVEVKSAKHTPPILKLDAITDFMSDAAVVCTVDGSRVDVWGCVSRRRFSRDHYVRDFGYGPRACLNADALSPISALTQAKEAN